MRRSRPLFLVLAMALTTAFGGAAERTVVEAILIRVNDRVITMSDFSERLRQELSQLPAPLERAELRNFSERLLGSIVEEMILLERAREKRIKVEDSTVNEAIKSLREENNLLDDEAFAEALRSSNLTIEALRDRYRQNIILRRAVQDEVQPTEVTEEEVRRMYEAEKERFRVPAKVELEQLFLEVAEDDSDRQQVLQRARGLVERVRKGADLAAEATLAGVMLQNLGAIPEADLRPEVTEALGVMPVGGLSDPIGVAGGFQVLRLVRRLPAGYESFDDVKETLRRRLSQDSFQSQTAGLVDRLKEEYLVEVNTELLPKVLSSYGDV